MNKEEFLGKLQLCYFGDRNAFKEIVSVYDDLQKKAELGEHYKHLYSEVKKQKDDVVEYITNTDDFDIEIFNESTGGCLGYDLSKGAKNILRMLGEIDVKD